MTQNDQERLHHAAYSVIVEQNAVANTREDLLAERDALKARLDHLQAAYDEIRTEYAAYREDRRLEHRSLQDWAAKVQSARTLVERPGEVCVWARKAVDEVTD